MKQSWKVKTLDELCSLVTCGVAARPEYIESGIPFLSAKNIKNGKIVWNNYKYISEEDHYKLTKKNKPKKGDLLYTRVGTIGNGAVIEEDSEFSIFVSLTLIKPIKKLISPYFLEKYLTSETVVEYAKKNLSGSGVGNLNVKTLRKFTIPVPSLKEQQKIVEVLDKAFADIDVIKANAEQNLKNTKELFDRLSDNFFDSVIKKHKSFKLKDITSKIGSGATPKGGQKSYKQEGISLIRSMNIHDYYFKEDKLAFIDDQQASLLNNVTVNESDVLFNITGASIARCCVVPEKYLPARVNQHVAIIRTVQDLVRPEFLQCLLSSSYFKSKLLLIGEKGSTRQAITKVNLEEFKIPVPTIQEQQKIIERLDNISKEVKLLDELYKKKIKDCDDLKKSLLDKSFKGELV